MMICRNKLLELGHATLNVLVLFIYLICGTEISIQHDHLGFRHGTYLWSFISRCRIVLTDMWNRRKPVCREQKAKRNDIVFVFYSSYFFKAFINHWIFKNLFCFFPPRTMRRKNNRSIKDVYLLRKSWMEGEFSYHSIHINTILNEITFASETYENCRAFCFF